MAQGLELPLGATRREATWYFNLWAPKLHEIQLLLEGKAYPMQRDHAGFHTASVPDARMVLHYSYQLPDGTKLPDPASRHQPEGVHGISECSALPYHWNDGNWRGLPLRSLVIYELHIGTFTEEGTCASATREFPRLVELGVTAVEIMPVAQFPGSRNWGYDGVGLFAVQNSYGGPSGLKEFVDAAHKHGLAVILDVVYNHLGPEGNYLDRFAPYFTDFYKTPWGQAVNFDQADSQHVRRYFIENALQWQEEFHIDGLRLDAVHAIYDYSAYPFLRQLSDATRLRSEKLGRPFHLIAESDLNAVRFVLPSHLGGYGLTAQWADDFHHCLHVLLTGEANGYYASYTGGLAQFAKVWAEGFAFTGEISKFRKAPHGEPTHLLSLRQFVVCAQNHDQVGNRMMGERLSAIVDADRLKLAAAAVLLSPFTPLLFMGEEYAESAPFQYFADHSDLSLIEAVKRGRKEEFAAFFSSGEAPDPFSLTTFDRCKLKPSLRNSDPHSYIYNWYRQLLSLRWTHPCFTECERHQLTIEANENLLSVTYHHPDHESVTLLMNFSPQKLDFPGSLRNTTLLLNSTQARSGGKPAAQILPWSVFVLSHSSAD